MSLSIKPVSAALLEKTDLIGKSVHILSFRIPMLFSFWVTTNRNHLYANQEVRLLSGMMKLYSKLMHKLSKSKSGIRIPSLLMILLEDQLMISVIFCQNQVSLSNVKCDQIQRQSIWIKRANQLELFN